MIRWYTWWWWSVIRGLHNREPFSEFSSLIGGHAAMYFWSPSRGQRSKRPRGLAHPSLAHRILSSCKVHSAHCILVIGHLGPGWYTRWIKQQPSFLWGQWKKKNGVAQRRESTSVTQRKTELPAIIIHNLLWQTRKEERIATITLNCYTNIYGRGEREREREAADSLTK